MPRRPRRTTRPRTAVQSRLHARTRRRYVGACIGKHRVREVDANRLRTALGRFRSDVAGACRDIEEPCPPAGAHRIEERLCDLRCHAAQEPVVGRGLLRCPAGFLERIECVGVVLGHDLKYERSLNDIGSMSPCASVRKEFASRRSPVRSRYAPSRKALLGGAFRSLLGHRRPLRSASGQLVGQLRVAEPDRSKRVPYLLALFGIAEGPCVVRGADGRATVE